MGTKQPKLGSPEPEKWRLTNHVGVAAGAPVVS